MTKARTELEAERAFRAALSQMGSHVGCAKGPVSGANTKTWVVENTISLSWRIGRAVAMARCTNQIDTVAESIIEEVGGQTSSKVLFKGKIVGVERITKMGHAYGEVVIEASSESMGSARERIVIPFKNENIFVKRLGLEGEEEVKNNPDALFASSVSLMSHPTQILAVAPDLVCVIDAQNGEAIGTQEYRYGLLVTVLGITASEKWTSTARGIEIGGPRGFGFNELEYKPIGNFEKPRSVIDEFDSPN